MSEPANMRDIRDRLVLASLPHVPFDGWSQRTLREAAKDGRLDPSLGERAFPGGAVAAVEHFAAMADRKLAEEASSADLDSLRLSERIAWLIKRRIEPWADHREAVRRAVTLLSLPTNGAAALRASWRTADQLWHSAGDSSTDFSYYTKRVTLAAVYASTLFYWLDDDSEEFIESWAFMRRRLADALQLTKLRTNFRQRFADLPNPLQLLAAKATGKRRFGVRQA
jgi:ubiquinone biosynthesis protein COQ9